MSYYISTMLDGDIAEASARVEAALKQEGFGVISRIDIRETLKAKISVDFRPYLILGACNPNLARRALEVEDKIGTMLPCNVVVREAAPGKVEVAAVDPVASMASVDNPQLGEVAAGGRDLLAEIVRKL